MNMRKLTIAGTVGALGLITLGGVGAAHADTKTAIDKGGAFCFQYGSTAPGATRTTLYLDIDPADHPTKQRLWWASGSEKGSNADVAAENYVNNLTGTATLAKPNNGRSGAKLIHLGLTGTSFGSLEDPNTTGLWTLDYNLQLNRKTLKGKIVGLSVFTPISGTTAGTPTTMAMSEKIKPISCSKL